MAMQTAETDINAAYEDVIHVLSTKPPKEEKRWSQQLHREIITATSGQNVWRLILILVVTGCFLSYRVLMAWVPHCSSSGHALTCDYIASESATFDHVTTLRRANATHQLAIATISSSSSSASVAPHRPHPQVPFCLALNPTADATRIVHSRHLELSS